MTWIAVALGLVGGYGFRHELGAVADRVRAELRPSAPVAYGPGRVDLLRADDGHFWADAEVNGVPVRFLVDTGATSVALPAAVARRIGLDLEALAYTRIVSTANGEARTAPVILERLAIGDAVVGDVPAGVAREGALDTPLLGMSYLRRLAGFSFEGDRLSLRF